MEEPILAGFRSNLILHGVEGIGRIRWPLQNTPSEEVCRPGRDKEGI